MISICINKKHYHIPENWNELTEKQLLQVMDIMFLKNYQAAEMLLRLLQALTGASSAAFLRWDVTEAEEFFYKTEFLLKEDIVFTKNILAKYQQTHTAFYGPADFLDNFRMKEFTLTEDLYVKWFDSKKKDAESLEEMIAILYRPAWAKYDFEKNPEGDPREKFNQNISHWYATTCICDWPMNVKLAIAAWYNGCRLHIIRTNPDVFGGTGGEAARYGMVSVMMGVAETNMFGDFEKVEEQYVNLIMMGLNETIAKGKRIEQMSKTP